MTTNESRDALTTERLGFHVARATSAFPTTGVTTSYFLVTGGRVEVTLLVGEVTTALQNSDPGISITSRATTGTAVVLNSTADVSSLEICAFIRVNGAGSALILSNAGASLSTAVGASGFVVPVGNIACIATTTKTGSVKFDLWYIPLDEGATVTAA
jgi:hypothetical protein